MTTRKPQVRSVEQQQIRKEKANLASRKAVESVREIGPLPAVENLARRESCQHSLRLFLLTYFPQSFLLEFGDDHHKIIARLETSILEGGLFALAMPRGSGKTTICVRALLWSIMYGHRKFAVLIGASGDAAKELLAELKVELETNLILAADFPEVCFPIQKLEGIAQRAKGQTLGGRQTQITYKGAQIILPTVSGSVASGSIIRVAGILGRIRGAKYVNSDGESMRPDFVIIDDPQTDASAKSENQCAQRERVLSGAILGLAGPGKRIAGVMPCTVIRKNDMADRILNRIIHPLWNGERCKMVYSWPSNQALWDKYIEWHISDLRQGNDKLPQATEFYRQNQSAMDLGSLVGWPARYEPHELSAIQHAVNRKLANPDTFEAEYQNEPKDAHRLANEHAADAEAICLRSSGYARLEIPGFAQHLVAAVDVQNSAFFYCLLAAGQNFTCQVVDYGVWPEQGKSYYTLQEIDRTIQIETGIGSLEASWLSGLRRLESFLLGRQYLRDDGQPMNLERIVIDANYGPSTQTIYSFVRQSEHRTMWLPWHGKGLTSTEKPMSTWPIKPGDIAGENWRIKPTQGRTQEPRHVIAETNYWKSFVHGRLMQPDGEQGAMMLFKGTPLQHRMFADHLTAEKPEVDNRRERNLVVWHALPNRDNHLFDCLVMATVAASTLGVKLRDMHAAPRPRPVAKSLSQLRDEALARRKK